MRPKPDAHSIRLTSRRSSQEITTEMVAEADANQPVVRPLGTIQQWMLAVITHPEGVAAGVDSAAAQRQIDVDAGSVENVIRRSRRLTSVDRLGVYANAYYARLLECLREEFPATVKALGSDTFDAFAFDFLQEHPSESYTLSNLGQRFPEFLKNSRPDDLADDSGAGWSDFLIDLATIERTYSEIFDGPGTENGRVLQVSDLTSLTPDDFGNAILHTAPCLRLLRLKFPVHEYITAVRHHTDSDVSDTGNADAGIPDPEPTWLVVTRRDFVVRRCAVSEAEYNLLSAIVSGQTLGEALGALESPSVPDSAPDSASETDANQLANELHEWFRRWSAAGWFTGISVDRKR